MACNTSLTAIVKGCDNNIGGIKSFFIAPEEFVSGATLSNGQITAVVMSGSQKFVQYNFTKNTANYVEAGAADLAAGSTLFTTTTTLTIPRRELAKRQAIQLIAAGQRDLNIIIEDMNGIFWWMGYQNFANLTATGEGSGAAKADGSKYTLTFVSEEPEQMPVVDPTIIPNIVTYSS